MSVARGNEHNNMPPADSFNDTLLTRPLMPNPNSSHPTNTNSSEVPSYYALGSQSTNLLALNHHLGCFSVGADNVVTSDGQSKSEFIHEQPLMGSSRWNPTPEQLLALEEMYRCGTRTPSAEQIQQIATQLRRFGKIEGKNVFYWFQNHKARERQKRRRREMETSNSEEKQQHNNGNTTEMKESGLRKTSYNVEQTKNWALSSTSSKHSEEIVSMQRAVAIPESTSGPQYGWTPFDERELQPRSKSTDNITKSTSQTVELWPSFDHNKMPKTQNLISGFSLFKKPYQQLANFNNQNNIGHETQTLELFPLHSRDDDGDDDDDSNSDNATKKDNKVVHITNINDTNNFTPSPSQYIEFLPLKN